MQPIMQVQPGKQREYFNVFCRKQLHYTSLPPAFIHTFYAAMITVWSEKELVNLKHYCNHHESNVRGGGVRQPSTAIF